MGWLATWFTPATLYDPGNAAAPADGVVRYVSGPNEHPLIPNDISCGHGMDALFQLLE